VGRWRSCGGAGCEHPGAEAEVEKPFLMPVEGRVFDYGAGDGGDGADRAGKVKVGEEVEMVGFGTDKKVVVTGVEMFRKLFG